jgi:hypothetical protein
MRERPCLEGEQVLLTHYLDKCGRHVPEELARRANNLVVPLHFSQRLFILKAHIAAAREALEKRRNAVPRAGET